MDGLAARDAYAVCDGVRGIADLHVLHPGPIARRSHLEQQRYDRDADQQLNECEAGLIVSAD